MLNSSHLVIDIETLDVRDSAAIIQIGCCGFGPVFESLADSGDSFGERADISEYHLWGCMISPFDDIENNATLSGETLRFLLKHNPQLLSEVISNNSGMVLDTKSGLSLFNSMLIKLETSSLSSDSKVYYWGNSPAFDMTIIKNANIRNDIENGSVLADSFRRHMDLRTLMTIHGEKSREIRNQVQPTVTHDAIDDAYKEAQLLKVLLNITLA